MSRRVLLLAAAAVSFVLSLVIIKKSSSRSAEVEVYQYTGPALAAGEKLDASKSHVTSVRVPADLQEHAKGLLTGTKGREKELAFLYPLAKPLAPGELLSVDHFWAADSLLGYQDAVDDARMLIVVPVDPETTPANVDVGSRVRLIPISNDTTVRAAREPAGSPPTAQLDCPPPDVEVATAEWRGNKRAAGQPPTHLGFLISNDPAQTEACRLGRRTTYRVALLARHSQSSPVRAAQNEEEP